MPRYRLTVEYDGGPFAGWQRQENGPSIQAALEAAIFRLSGEQITVTGAGRTDAGVHALAQSAHFDLEREFAPETVRDAVNHYLRPVPIAVLSAQIAAPEFHARFDAVGRHYLYRMICRKAPLTLERGRAWHITHTLDAEAMHEAAQTLVGQHDFTTFRASECQAKSPVKTLDRIVVSRRADEVHVETSARSFLHHQVRSMVGSLKLVGEARWTARDLLRALEARDRARCGPVAPPEGLYLVRVDYPS
jgi:tRNA pseudouridine38-40 synthase